ncbi:universal stress protein [Ramlibacter sp. XY19]|uniref:universal stress protein n=1 Tax=Ramlibacter paludis TaxID=2908000 RepID=UPI0023DB333B|nr:universal stress protein [Ramlibacter paludis]MCG2594399.1 universal stress protein [Ramlibacter paludis]
MTASYQQILVHLDPGVAAPARLAFARKLAEQQGAALAALYATTPVFVGLPYAPEMVPSMAEALAAIEDERRERTHKMFDETLRTPGAPVAWSEAIEFPIEAVVAQQALFADLLVLGQRHPGDPLAASVPPDFAEAVIIASGRPAIVVPYVGGTGRLGETVAIAWKETREAARAVAAALPLLQRAKKVHVLCWSEEPAAAVEGAGLDLRGYLHRHGVEVDWQHGGPAPASFGEALLSRTFDLGADLLVMGCYGHSRAREWVLGGASRSVLDAMTLPVLMAH